MAKMKVLVVGLVIGLLVGLWGGVNIGKGRPLLSNPLADTPVDRKLKDSGRSLVRESGEALEKTGEALKEKASEGGEH